MKLGDWLKQATTGLEQANIGTARLDALVLLEDFTGKNRAWLLAHLNNIMEDPVFNKLNQQLKRRMNHEPLAYIRGKTEFYGREFLINNAVLEPRPESEAIIELLKELVDSRHQPADRKYIILDIGTGSGALAVSAKLEIPEAEVIATDIDPKCLWVAGQNSKKHRVNIKLFSGNLLEPLTPLHHNPVVILANLPYVPDGFTINQAAMNEPKIAIFGGKDGLDIYRSLFRQIAGILQGLKKPKYILTESLPSQHDKLKKIAQETGYQLKTTNDFIQLFEVVN